MRWSSSSGRRRSARSAFGGFGDIDGHEASRCISTICVRRDASHAQTMKTCGPRSMNTRTGKRTQIRQAVRIARQQLFELKVGARGSLVCWGVMPSGLLRHPLSTLDAVILTQ
jgi:hypothetical protein